MCSKVTSKLYSNSCSKVLKIRTENLCRDYSTYMGVCWKLNKNGSLPELIWTSLYLLVFTLACLSNRNKRAKHELWWDRKTHFLEDSWRGNVILRIVFLETDSGAESITVFLIDFDFFMKKLKRRCVGRLQLLLPFNCVFSNHRNVNLPQDRHCYYYPSSSLFSPTLTLKSPTGWFYDHFELIQSF